MQKRRGEKEKKERERVRRGFGDLSPETSWENLGGESELVTPSSIPSVMADEVPWSKAGVNMFPLRNNLAGNLV